MARAPGTIRDAIVRYLSAAGKVASLPEIREAISKELGEVSPSSVRSYLNLNVPNTFERTGRGTYRLKKKLSEHDSVCARPGGGRSQLILADCFDWLAQCQSSSIHAVVTDPPYGLVEYTEKEQTKLRN